VSSPDSAKRALEQLQERLGGLDVLINNAGISIRHRFVDITPEEWKRVIDINLNGVFFVAQQAALHMLAGDGGVIINMGSTNGLAGYHYYGDYNASKSGVIELTRSMALELGPTIRVNAVCPGFIMTPMQEAEYTPEMQRAFYDKLPLKRLGSPNDVASLFAFLASDEASWITGQHFVIGSDVSEQKLEAARSLVAYITSSQRQLERMRQFGTAPTHRETLDDESVQSDPLWQVSVAQMLAGRGASLGSNPTMLLEAMREPLAAVMDDQMTPTEAARQMQERAE